MLVKMKPSLARTALAGVTGFVALVLALFLTFAKFGGSQRGQTGVLFDPATQSPKLIAVWKEMSPLPLLIEAPAVIFAGYLAFAIGHAFLFRSVRAAWPPGIAHRGLRMALIIWSSSAFFELQGPVNLFHQPARPFAIALTFWAIAALAEAFAIVAVIERDRATVMRASARSSSSGAMER